ncbi:MAG: hypothetical protein HYX50_00225 [Chloroflexi bacterium]|nr:hypothetical protein [Chloroflexota bacterium]
MDRAQALRTLRLDPSADGRTIESAYWNLVRRAQERSEHDATAAAEVDALNDAYGALAPERREMLVSKPAGDGGTGFALLDGFADWLSLEAGRTRRRWANRNPEIAMLGAGGLILWVLAVSAGAAVLLSFAALLLMAAGIWAPWRRSD